MQSILNRKYVGDKTSKDAREF